MSNQEKAAQRLALADKYAQAYLQDPAAFALPDKHKELEPIVKEYARDLEGFVDLIVRVRDSVERSCAAWEQLQALYRRIKGRHTQQIRRERSDRAIQKAEELYGWVEFHQRLAWVARLEHAWAQRRLAHLDDYRAKTANGRLSTDERSEILLEFWDIIDNEIYEGEVPPWN